LEKLNLSSNALESVPPKTFFHNDGLLHLDLSHNSIHSLSIDAFRKSTSRLQSIDLSYNRLTVIQSNTFGLGDKNAFTRLQSINLSANAIEKLEHYAFGDLEALKRLDLSKNKISKPETDFPFGQMDALEELNLAENQLSKPESMPLSLAPSLQRLNLSSNSISHLSDQSFAYNPRLWSLDLSGNQIDILTERFFSHQIALVALKLDNNPLCPVEKGGENLCGLHQAKWHGYSHDVRFKLSAMRVKCQLNQMRHYRNLGYSEELAEECRESKELKFAREIGLVY